MGIGREVADAYIDVHGDLKSFRKDLEKANPEGKQMGEDFMTEFGKGMEERGKRDLSRRWNSVMDAIHNSGDKFDFGRMIDTFDPTNFDNALDKIREFTAGMADAGKIGLDEWVQMDDAIRGQADSIRQVQDERQKLNDMMTEAIADNKAYDRSFQGITRSIKDADLEGDFRKIAEAMARGDISKWAKGFDNFDQLNARVHTVTDAMQDLGRMTDEDAAKARSFTDQYIQNQQAISAAEKQALDDATARREAQDRYRKSLDGMVEAHHFQKVQSDFDDLTRAIGTADWSKFGKGADDVQQFRDRVIQSAAEMRHFGKITDEEFGHIIDHLDKVSADLDGHNVKLGEADGHTRQWGISMGDVRDKARELSGHLAGTFSHFKGLAGLNVFGNMLEDGLKIAQNIDGVAVSISQASLKIGSAISLISSAAASVVTIGADVASAANVAWLAPGFLAAAGIQIGVVVAAMKDMKTKLKDLGPAFSELQNNISDAFWKQAEQPIRDLVNSLLPTLRTQLKNTATSMGGLFKAFADGFAKAATPAKVEGMFRRMNGAIDKARGMMGPLTDAFVTLGDFSSQYFGRFADWMVKLSRDFDSFVTKAVKDGRMKRWVEDGIQSFKDMGSVISSALGIFQGLNDAAAQAGFGGLSSLADTMGRMRDIANSSEFKTGLSTWLQGAKDATDSIVGAINDRLFPALGNIAPTAQTALQIIGETMGTIIGDLASVIENPNVQNGILQLTTGLQKAIDTFQPAIKPMGDSLGNLLDISGHIVQNVATIVTAFTVNLGPVIDEMGRKFETMADPLTNSVTNAITNLTPVFKSLSDNVVGPITSAISNQLLPSIDDFVSKAGPLLTQIVEKVGPVLATLVKDVLPNAVKFAGELVPAVRDLVDLITPAFATTLKDVGTGFQQAAEGMKALKGETNDFKWGFPKVTSPTEDLKKQWGQASANGFWEDLGNILFGGNLADMGQRMMTAWSDDITGAFQGMGKTVADGWNKVWSGKILGDQPGKWFGEVGKAFDDFFNHGGVQNLNDSVNKWFDDTIFKPIRDAWDNAMKGIHDWWDGVKSGFQDFMSGLLGFNTKPGGDGSVSVAGGHGMSAGGKITPEMLGLGAPDDNWLQGTIDKVKLGIQDLFNQGVTAVTDFSAPFVEGWNTFWSTMPQTVSDTWTGITTTLGEWWTSITTNLGIWLAGLGENWNTFWGGFGTTIGEIWTGITTTLATWWTTITTNLSTWFVQIQTGWDTFWAQLPVTVSAIWTQITTWIATQATLISTNIANFATTVRTNWDSFWGTVWTKVSTIWAQITGWIATQVTMIQTNISNFITTVRTNWDGFWNTVNQKVQSIWATISGWIGSKAAEIQGKIDSMISTVKTNWDNFWSTINQKVSEWWGKIVTGVQTGITNVVTEAGTLVSKATNAVGDTIGVLAQKGKDFAQGFINGISSMVGDIAAAAASFVQSAIDAATNQQDSHSPSKVTLGLGHDYGDGYVLGVKDRFDAAQTAAEGLVGAALSGLSTSRMYSAGVEAALGLADGLKSQGSLMESTLSAMIPDLQAQITASGNGFGTAPADGTAAPAGKTVIFNEGAVVVDSKASNPGVVASMVIDDIADIFDSSDT